MQKVMSLFKSAEIKKGDEDLNITIPAPTEASEKVELAVTSSKGSEDGEILLHAAVKSGPGIPPLVSVPLNYHPSSINCYLNYPPRLYCARNYNNHVGISSIIISYRPHRPIIVPLLSHYRHGLIIISYHIISSSIPHGPF
jgi:hypothetical protein